MAYKVVIAQSAIEDLQEIVSCIVQDDPQLAIRVGNKLIDHALTLGAFPERCPLFDTAQGIRKMVAAPYLIFFTMDHAAATVNIIHFWHGARQYPDFEK